MQLNLPRKQLRVHANYSMDKTLKEYGKVITQSLHKLNTFTDNLQAKVNTMLKAQQNQFVTSYKNHMANIKGQLNEMQRKIQQYQNQIEYYQNQGRLSHYIKKVNFMELQQIRLFQQIETKDKKIKDLLIEIYFWKKQQKFANGKIKQMYRKRIVDQQQKTNLQDQSSFSKKQPLHSHFQLQSTQNKHLSSIQTFATQIPSYTHNKKSNKGTSRSKDLNITKLITNDQQNSSIRSKFNPLSQGGLGRKDQSLEIISHDEKSVKISALQKQISHLKIQNKKLHMFNSKYASNLSELGQFFLRSVDQLKKSIGVKRKIKHNVSFQDFCKQDKLVLIATLLASQQVLMLIYDKIFKPSPHKNRVQSVLQKSYGKKQSLAPKSHRTIQQIMSNPQKNVQTVDRISFPSVRSKRLIY